MNERKSARYYLAAAIIWTVIAALALALMLVMQTTAYVKFCCLLLIGMCVVSQWMRYRKMK